VSKKYGTYLVEFTDGTAAVFGNNYKPWWQHAAEYIYGSFKNPERGWRYSDVADKIAGVKFSDMPFYDDGGLKWATPKGYQEVIDDVCAKTNRTHVQFGDIPFEPSRADASVLTKKLRYYGS
jgi:hypothetical protein